MDTGRLRHLLAVGQLEPYIRHIRFPRYKNISAFTDIQFTFPITALVGANGTNKSSLLRALYGSPGNNNLGNFWFSTDTDPIEEGQEYPNCFVYGYVNRFSNELVEILKTRIRKENGPDYWEPSRPIRRYEMAPMPPRQREDPNRLATRWKAVTKHVELIDFRHALSAFDKYFYYGNFKRSSTFKNKKDFVRARAVHLNTAITERAPSYVFHRKDRIVDSENRVLSANELSAISRILGRNYEEIQLVRHTFFNQDGYTARIKHADLSYTEAFAGSGEFAAIMIVSTIMGAPEKSLILLDEPEVSLHPGAQEHLLAFFESEVVRKKHQIIFTTHSPALIRGLPPEAIKVFALESTGVEVVLVAQSSLPEEAFLEIGEALPGFKTILVEDRLAAEVVKKALRIHAPTLLRAIQTKYFPGGFSAIFRHYVAPYAAEARADVLCILDGDQQPETQWPDEESVRATRDSELQGLVLRQCGCDVDFPLNSGTAAERQAQRVAISRNFLNWCGNFVRYLPGNVKPEQFILEKLNRSDGSDAKQQFVALSRSELGLLETEGPSAEDIFNTQRRLLNEIPDDDRDLQTVATTIIQFLARS